MKNTNPKAVVTLGDLDIKYFTQDIDGKITLNPDGALPDDKVIRYTAGADAFTGTVELFDPSANAVVWSASATNDYSAQGVYLGTKLNFALADLEQTTNGGLAHGKHNCHCYCPYARRYEVGEWGLCLHPFRLD